MKTNNQLAFPIPPGDTSPTGPDASSFASPGDHYDDDAAARICRARRNPEMPVLTAPDAAALLSISLKQLRAFIRTGRLTATLIGPRTLRIAYADVLAFVNYHQVDPASTPVPVPGPRPAGRANRRTTLFDADDGLAA